MLSDCCVAALHVGLAYLGNERLAGWVASVRSTCGTSGRAPLLFRQLYEAESSTYTYLLADTATGAAQRSAAHFV